MFFFGWFQEANKRNNSSLPPPWAIAAILLLGFNEFMTLLRWLIYLDEFQYYIPQLLINSYTLHCRNPLYLGVIFVVFLVGKAIWVQLDIPGEFRNGAVSVNTLSEFKLYSFLVKPMCILSLDIVLYLAASGASLLIHKVSPNSDEHP